MSSSLENDTKKSSFTTFMSETVSKLWEIVAPHSKQVEWQANQQEQEDEKVQSTWARDEGKRHMSPSYKRQLQQGRQETKQ